MTKTKCSLQTSTTARPNPKRSVSTIRSRKKDSSRAMTKSVEVHKQDPTRRSKGGTKCKEENVSFVSPQQDYSLEMFCSPEADRSASEEQSIDTSAPEVAEVTPDAKTTEEFLPPQSTTEKKLFPEILFDMVNAGTVNHSSLIRWVDDGRSFFVNIADRGKLGKVIVPFFPHGNYSSLRRQLSLYRFKFVDNPKAKARRYFHPHFHRGSNSQDFLVIRQGKQMRRIRGGRRSKSLKNVPEDKRARTDSSEDMELECLWGSVHHDPTIGGELHFMPLLPLDDQVLLLDDDSPSSIDSENGAIIESPSIKLEYSGLVESSLSIERAKEDVLYSAASKINIQQTPPSLKKLHQLFTGEVNENDVAISLFQTPLKEAPVSMGGIGSAFRQVASRTDSGPEDPVETDELCLYE